MLLLSIAIAGSSLAAGASVAGGPAAAGPSLRSNVVYAFEAPPPSASYSSLLRRNDGKFYGTLALGGPGGHGAIYRYDAIAGTAEILHLFGGDDGARPYGALVNGPQGAVFGTTLRGGANGSGTLFRYDVGLQSLTTLHAFGASDRQEGVVLASDGRLYGTVQGGGFSTSIFRYDLATATYSVVQTLATGGPAMAPLMEATDGRLYGVGGCGSGTGGSIFRYDPVTSTGEVLRPFVQASGSNPCAPLFQAADGLLYGTTTSGGASQRGVLFRFDPVSLSYAVLDDFDPATGLQPMGGLFQGADGALYGTTSQEGVHRQGTLFRYDFVSSTLTVRHHFGGATGFAPRAALIDAGDGSLLGTTSGTNFMVDAGRGTIYRYVPSTDVVEPEYGFGRGGPSGPQADLLLGADGSLYGTTAEGGPGGEGTLFRYDVAAGQLKTVYGFDGTLGGGSLAGVIVGADGALYGTAARGGTDGLGTLFRYAPGGGVTALHHFDGSSEWLAVPRGRLTPLSDGTLWGTTSGAPYNYFGGGSVFRYDPATGAVDEMATFSERPLAGLIEASDGMLYGTRARDVGGPSHWFRLDPGNAAVSHVMYLTGPSVPSAEVVEHDGALYCAVASLSHSGAIYRYDLASGAATVPVVFTGPDGDTPLSTLIRGPDGALYGTTELGGAYGLGTVFRFDPVTLTHDVIHSFRGSDGANPRAGVVFTANGTMFGTTPKGGPKGGGVIFRIIRWR